jgi:hypothetical protein
MAYYDLTNVSRNPIYLWTNQHKNIAYEINYPDVRSFSIRRHDAGGMQPKQPGRLRGCVSHELKLERYQQLDRSNQQSAQYE